VAALAVEFFLALLFRRKRFPGQVMPIVKVGHDIEAVVKEKQEKALAEHVARHPEDVGRTVEDFKWILWIVVRRAAPRKSEDDTAEYIETLRAAREAPIGSGGNANGGAG
jgi:replicative superfamily II helicase